MSEQEARIALYREYGSNARNWYNVLLALAIAFFTAVQVRQVLPTCLWWSILIMMLSQAPYVIIRAVVGVRLAEYVVEVKMPESFDPKRTYVEVLREKIKKDVENNVPLLGPWWKRGVGLGTPGGWLYWILASALLTVFLVFVLPCVVIAVVRCDCCGALCALSLTLQP